MKIKYGTIMNAKATRDEVTVSSICTREMKYIKQKYRISPQNIGYPSE